MSYITSLLPSIPFLASIVPPSFIGINLLAERLFTMFLNIVINEAEKKKRKRVKK